MDKQRIKDEADAFFEWPTPDKTYVTTTSMLIFTSVIAEMAKAEERAACADVCDKIGTEYHDAVSVECGRRIRAR